MIYWLVSLLHGFCNSINKMMNVKAGQVFGTANGALINYIEATFLSLALIFLTGKGGELSPGNLARIPFWAFLGGVCGLAAMVMLIAATPHTNVLLSSILTLVGNLGAALVLDYLLLGIFSWWKVAGITLILLGTTWIEKTGQTEKKQTTENRDA